MGRLTVYMSNLFSKPTGLGSKISTLAMNVINQPQYKSVTDNIDLEY